MDLYILIYKLKKIGIQMNKSEIGNIYGSMTIVKELPSITSGKNNKKIRIVKVKCNSCNKISEKRLDNIRRKSTSGCSRDCPEFKKRITKHGLSSTLVYKSWDNMVTRVTRPSHKNFKHYDHLIQGEKIDPRWLKFQNFLDDMGEPKNKKFKFSIDRRNNRLGYFKENCKWSTQKEQTLNQEKSIVNRFTRNELQTIKNFHLLASRFKKDGVQLFTTLDISRIFNIGVQSITKILNNYYIDLAKQKENSET